MGNGPESTDDLTPGIGPPVVLVRVFQRCLPKAVRDPILGDLFEDYLICRSIHGERVAAWRYACEGLVGIAYGLLMAGTIDRDEWREMSMTQRSGSIRKAFAGVGVLVVFWLLLFISARLFEALPGREIIQVLATATAVVLAVYLRVRLVALFLAAMLSFNLAELLVHAIWTASAVRGAPTHFAVMGAGLLGVILGLVVNRYVSAGDRKTATV